MAVVAGDHVYVRPLAPYHHRHAAHVHEPLPRFTLPSPPPLPMGLFRAYSVCPLLLFSFILPHGTSPTSSTYAVGKPGNAEGGVDREVVVVGERAEGTEAESECDASEHDGGIGFFGLAN